MRTRAATLKVWAALLAVMAAAMVVVALAVGTEPAKAAFPGSNGAIAFTSDQDGDLDIYRMAPDGFGGAYSAKLTESVSPDVGPVWNAEGTRIAFVSVADEKFEIFRMDASGNNETRLTITPTNDSYQPAWFPTDTKLAFVSNRPDAQNTFDNEIYVMTLNENANPVGNPQRITTSPASDELPAISPSGKMIAFASKRDGDFEIYAMKAAPESATNRPVKLTNNTVSDTAPDWSPNGQRIVFESERSGSPTEHEIVVMNADGTQQKLLTNNTFDDVDPAFSPDGRRIAYESSRASSGNPGYRDIFRMRADGANKFNLTNSGATDANASWQPN